MAGSVRTLRTKLRDFALTLPEVHEDMPWGERALKVKNKVFLFIGRDMDTDFGLSVKLPKSSKTALHMPFTSPTGYGLGKSGWVTAKLDDRAQASFEMLRDWVKESYCAVAPKGLADQVQPDPKKAKAAKKAKAKTAEVEATKRKSKAEGRAKSTSLPIGRSKRAAKR